MNASLEYVQHMQSMLEEGGPGHRFYGWLLGYGCDMRYEPLPEGYPKYLPRTLKQCYSNALFLAQSDPKRYIYCEGIATNLIPVSHAWCLDMGRGCVVDPTWDGLRNTPDSYLGVPFNLKFALGVVLKYGCYGLAWGNFRVANDWLEDGIDWGEALHSPAAAELNKLNAEQKTGVSA